MKVRLFFFVCSACTTQHRARTNKKNDPAEIRTYLTTAIIELKIFIFQHLMRKTIGFSVYVQSWMWQNSVVFRPETKAGFVCCLALVVYGSEQNKYR